ncbi:MAG TPA: Gfo/Idh/MocA family oxidoreductase [Steroidobacteraceae bacterium]|jgi:predicted dehydrogenase|nr:Gfo/Idh/MocA family oxidoreductase [Steroidobacteraceae bacterium]
MSDRKHPNPSVPDDSIRSDSDARPGTGGARPDTRDLTRREFVASAGTATLGAVVAAGAPLILPSRVLARARAKRGERVNLAIVGFGGMGSQNALVLAQTDHIGAVCDVDFNFSERCLEGKMTDGGGQPLEGAANLREQFQKARRYADFRELLDKEKSIEGVVIATPDHAHAVIAKAAMQLGKHVYVQKPLVATVHEARALRSLALENPHLVTQMGNQGHSSEGARLINEWIAAGVIGPVREVHLWTNRPVVYWPQGLPRPTGIPAPTPPARFGNPWTYRHVQDVLAAAMGSGGAPPPGLDWDLFLGPIAEDVPYHPIYHPFNWRGWTAFGCGAIGDMGAHLMDHAYWALGLTYPESIEATSTEWGTMAVPGTASDAASSERNRRKVSYPVSTCVHYRFPARGTQPPVKMSWFDGGIYPPRPDALPDDVELRSEGGGILIGDKGILIHETYGKNPRVFPDSLAAAAAAVPKTLPRIPWSHEANWTKAIRGQATASSPLEYAGRLTECMLLGLVALRTGPGRKIDYDGESGSITNIAEANQYLTREYRSGWSV